jgi:hypothetical protein
MSARYAIGAIYLCPRCGNTMLEDMPIYNGTMEQHIVVCGDCYDLVHDRYMKQRAEWTHRYWQAEFDNIIAAHDGSN